MPEPQAPASPTGLTGRAWWWGLGLTVLIALLGTVPTTGDIGLTWDEPSYRASQLVSAQWWEAWGKVRTREDAGKLLGADALLFYWPYARFGYNFHPPLAGQLDLLTHALFGRWMKDIPSRRLASVFEYAATIALAFGFLSRRYGPWVGGVAAGALVVMPRVYGDGHIAGTDTPGLLLWPLTVIAFWKGLREPGARRWRVLVGVAVGLGFLVKMGTIVVLGPILIWTVAARLPRTLRSRGGRVAWIDGIATSAAMLLPLALAFGEVVRLARAFPPPAETDLFLMRRSTPLPGAILLAPLAVWVVRRLVGRLRRSSPIWGAERPALEVWTAVLAFAPAVGWLGNPGWWRDTLPRMAHYYALSADRRGALPDIRILYLGEIYNYSLPWHNAWVLIAITVPVGILVASLVGLITALIRGWRAGDPLPLFFALNLIFLPALRMLPIPAHDGVRLFLPTFFFLAAFAGWGVVAMAGALARPIRHPVACRAAVAGLVLGSAAVQLIRIHPFELSYYNELIGGPRGAWKSGFELSYWYEAFDGDTLADLNDDAVLPDGSSVDFTNDLINTPSLACLQELGRLKGTITLGWADLDHVPHGWMLTHDSKATPLTRLLFAMTPKYARTPRQLDGLRVVTVNSPETVARAWALHLLTRGASWPEVEHAPPWVLASPWLRPFARFWGEGISKGPRPAIVEEVFDRARTGPSGLIRSAREVARDPTGPGPDPTADRLRAFLRRRYGTPDETDKRFDWRADLLLHIRPEALVEAASILVAHPDAVRSVLLRPGFTDPATIGGYLDRDLVGGKPR